MVGEKTCAEKHGPELVLLGEVTRERGKSAHSGPQAGVRDLSFYAGGQVSFSP